MYFSFYSQVINLHKEEECLMVYAVLLTLLFINLNTLNWIKSYLSNYIKCVNYMLHPMPVLFLAKLMTSLCVGRCQTMCSNTEVFFWMLHLVRRTCSNVALIFLEMNKEHSSFALVSESPRHNIEKPKKL